MGMWARDGDGDGDDSENETETEIEVDDGIAGMSKVEAGTMA